MLDGKNANGREGFLGQSQRFKLEISCDSRQKGPTVHGALLGPFCPYQRQSMPQDKSCKRLLS